MNSANYTCKFCQRPGTVHYDPAGMVTLAKWLPHLACNRCGDYHATRLNIEDRVMRVCNRLIRMRAFGSSSDLEAVETTSRKLLDALTKEFSKLTANHFRITPVWEAAFTDVLMDKPHKSRSALRFYQEGIRKTASPIDPADVPRSYKD